MRDWKKVLSIMLIFTMLFSVSAPVFASDDKKGSKVIKGMESLSDEREIKLKSAIENVTLKNRSEHSPSSQKLIMQATENPENNLEFADVINGETVLVYKTSNNNVKIAITENYAEILEKVDQNTFLINGEEHTINYTYEEGTENSTGEFSTSDSKKLNPISKFPENDTTVGALAGTYDNYAVIGNPGGSWTRVTSGYHNFHFDNAIGTYTAAALTDLVGLVLGKKLGDGWGAVGGFLVGIFLGSQYTNTSVAKAFIVHYKHASYPFLYKKSTTAGYAVWGSKSYYLDTRSHYYSKMICNVC